MFASANGKEAIVAALLQRGAAVDMQSKMAARC